MSVNPAARIDPSGFRLLEEAMMPIFSRKAGDLTLFYAPGYLAAAREKEAQEIRDILSGEIPFGNMTAAYLIEAARSAQSEWYRRHDLLNYAPTCLTVYSSQACNLKCSYCFAEHERDPRTDLDTERFADAVWDVAFNCSQADIPFTAVFHGGGEPSLDPRLPELLQTVRTICGTVRVPLYTYIATNGVMDAEKARWIAGQFDEIGLSVDGPPEIQNAQRPLRGGGQTSETVERTAAIFKEMKGRLTVRVTVPPENFSRIPEIADYCSGTLLADEIRIEPVYCRGTASDPDLADEFCENYLAAKKEFRNLAFSGSRIGEIHGRYCQVFRKVLHLVPPRGCSPCFVLSSEMEAMREFPDFDPENALGLEMLSAEDPACESCFNRFHCARGCPDVCPALPGTLRDAGSFRCRVNRTLAEAELLETAGRSLFGFAEKYGYAGIKIRGE